MTLQVILKTSVKTMTMYGSTAIYTSKQTSIYYWYSGLEIGKKIGLPLCLVFDRWSKFSLPFDFFLAFHYHFGLSNTNRGLPFGRWQAA